MGSEGRRAAPLPRCIQPRPDLPRCSPPTDPTAPSTDRPAEAAEVWIVEDGEVHPWDGDFEDYKDELVREIAAELDEQVR